MKPIYLDYNATTPIDPEVANAMKPFLDQYFGNPSSSHLFGIETRKAVEKARKQVANLLNCNSDEIIFTSGGTESNNYALKGAALANRNKGNHIISSQIEHPAIIEVCKHLETIGFEISYIPVDTYGIVDLQALKDAIRTDTILISVMHANNEVGSVQPIEEISAIAKKNDILFHSDAAQSVGKIKTDVRAMGVDMLSVAGHKLYAPKGIGALYIRRGVRLEKLIHGADHEQNFRAGTENVLEIVGLGKACELAATSLEKNHDHLKNMRDKLHQGLTSDLINLRLNGHPEKRLPNTLSLGFYNIEANTLLSEMDEIAASAGAACHTDQEDISSVLGAMKVPDEYAMGTIRFSVGKYTTEKEIEKAIEVVKRTLEKLKPTDSAQPTEQKAAKDIRLTQYTHGLGCACKIRPQYLERILRDFEVPTHPNILVGNNTSDDAAVYLINDDTAIVQTVDFFTPVVDDPYQFGAIAAANALSDIYAMGAKPLFALNIVGFPDNRLPEETLKQILKGANDKAKEAGIYILGGHTIEDPEPKFGMVVTGTVHPDNIWTNDGAKPGDVLILTKTIGTGILSTAMKRGLTEAHTERSIFESMSMLNNKAAEIASDYDIHACTDITGFGLLGHLSEMTRGSNVTAEIFTDQVPYFKEALEFITSNVIPGGTKNNLDYVGNMVEFEQNVPNSFRYLLADAQTSGGLLFAVPQSISGNLISRLKEKGIQTNEIGIITEKRESEIIVKM